MALSKKIFLHLDVRICIHKYRRLALNGTSNAHNVGNITYDNKVLKWFD